MNQDNIKINPITVIAIFFQIIFIIFAVVTLRNLLSEEQTIARVAIDNYSIANFDSFSLDATKKSVIEGELNRTIAFNGVGPTLNRDAMIRDGSVYDTYIEDMDVKYLSFIIDIDSSKQSYRLVYRSTDTYPNNAVPTDNPAIVFCLNHDSKIYEEFKCKDDYPDNIEDIIVYDMVSNKEFNNFVVDVVGNAYRNETISFRIKAKDGNSSSNKSDVSELSDYLSSLGFSLDNYKYEYE